MSTLLTLLTPPRIESGYQGGFWKHDTLYTLACAHAERDPTALAFRDRFRDITYRDLLNATDALALDLHQRGVRPGQRVAVWLPSRLETALTLLACSRNGYVCCPSLHRDHTVGEVVALLGRVRAVALVAQIGYGADADREDLFNRASEISSLRHVYRLGPLNADEAAMPPFATVIDSASPDDPGPIAEAEPERVVYVAFTSGTTGEPKGVMHSDNTLLANARALTTDWHLDDQSVIYTMSPLSHNLGIGSLIGALTIGGQLVVHDLPSGESLFARLASTAASFLVGVPTHAFDLLQELKAEPTRKLPNLTGFRISGAAVSRSVVEGLIQHGIKPQSGYGMTESCSNNYTLPHDSVARIVETSGRAAPGYEIKIWKREDPNLEAPVGEVGQIGGRGSSLMLGYFDDQNATEDAFNATGWFMTGDLGWMDADGYLRVTGREKEIIIRGGHNIFPARIEALAMRHEAVVRAAALPVADARLGEKVCLAVTLKSPGQVPVEDLLQHLDSAGLSKFDMPEYFLEIDDIPLTASGKILKRELVTWIQERRVDPTPVRWTPSTHRQRR